MLVSLIWARNWAFFNKLCKAGHFFAPKIMMTSLPRDQFANFISLQFKSDILSVVFMVKQGHGQQGYPAQFANRHGVES